MYLALAVLFVAGSSLGASSRKPEYSRETLPDGAESIRTPYGEYVVVPEKAAEGSDLAGGIGVQLTQSQGEFILAKVFARSPAAKAGLKSGDVVKAVSDETGRLAKTSAMALGDVVRHLRGKAGTKAAVQVFRPASGKVITATVVRSASAFSGSETTSST
ncbi:MAG: PDZ domain-containing protein [Elusimicrobia bacterium]|nr:PDZ domain-containing protein [Elusimicrobiota bacterium]